MGNFLSACLQACFFFVVLLWMSPAKTIVGFAALLVLGPVVRLSNRYVRRLSHDVIEHFAEVQRSIVHATRNWVLIRVLRTESLELARLQHASLATTQKSLRIELVNGLSAGLPEMVGIVVAAILIALQYGTDRGPATAFVAFLYLFLRFSQCLVQIGAQSGALHANYPSFLRSADFILKISDKDLKSGVLPLQSLSFFGRTHPEHFQSDKFAISDGDLIHVAPAIAFRNVSFSYGEGATILRDLSFEVAAGSALGIVGPSGVGKSTVLALLMGFEVPDQGQLRFVVQGKEFGPLNHQLSIGYVGPEPFLVAGSVANNLLYGSRCQASSGALIATLKKAGFSENDAELSALLASQLTESGEGLSTGQKQRLCLARALLSRPALLILDEVSANLDSHTELKIAKSVDALRGQSTVIIVSHRDAMLTSCDRVLDLGSCQLKVRS
jgi:ABC-type multidrug transport system fused ATPase/permease subunit